MDSVPKGLSRLAVVAVREIWKHEAHDFTLWLLENADVLGEALGMDLELTEAERKVSRRLRHFWSRALDEGLL